jgi:hypothetical protein
MLRTSLPSPSDRVANERDDRIAALEYAADDLAADAAGGADYCGGLVSPFGRARSVQGRPDRIFSDRFPKT